MASTYNGPHGLTEWWQR